MTTKKIHSLVHVMCASVIAFFPLSSMLCYGNNKKKPLVCACCSFPCILADSHLHDVGITLKCGFETWVYTYLLRFFSLVTPCTIQHGTYIRFTGRVLLLWQCYSATTAAPFLCIRVQYETLLKV